MPPSLRKACHACTKSKRRCVPQLPRCNRCAQKQIPCIYDLEPVSQASTESASQQGTRWDGARDVQLRERQHQPESLQIVYTSIPAARDASINAVAGGYSTSSLATRPRIVGSAEETGWVLGFFSQVVRDGLAGRGTPFVHAHLLHSTFDEPTVAVDSNGANTRRGYCSRLTEIHDLIVQTFKLLLLDRHTKPLLDEVERGVAQTVSTIHNLWSSPPQQFDPSIPPWETWLIAESIRRSMFAAVMLKGIFSIVRNGFSHYTPYFESFPFDPRAGLWEAETAEQWERRITHHGGEHVKLKSYYEFITNSATGSKLDPEEDGAFQRILFVCYHGDVGIRVLEELDKELEKTNVRASASANPIADKEFDNKSNHLEPRSA